MGTTRLILVCAVALLQVAASSGHLLYHALEGVEAEHYACDAAIVGGAHGTIAAHDDDCCASRPTSHDHDSCRFCCDARNADAVPGAQKQRSVNGAGLTCLADRFDVTPLSAGEMLRSPGAARVLNPTDLHQITFPLLD